MAKYIAELLHDNGILVQRIIFANFPVFVHGGEPKPGAFRAKDCWYRLLHLHLAMPTTLLSTIDTVIIITGIRVTGMELLSESDEGKLRNYFLIFLWNVFRFMARETVKKKSGIRYGITEHEDVSITARNS